MKRVKFFLAFLAIGIMLSACEFSPEEIKPVGDIILEMDRGTSGTGTEEPPLDPPDED